MWLILRLAVLPPPPSLSFSLSFSVVVVGIFSIGFFGFRFDGFVELLDLDLVSSRLDLLVSVGISVSHHFCANKPLSLACRSVFMMSCFSSAASGGDLLFLVFLFVFLFLLPSLLG